MATRTSTASTQKITVLKPFEHNISPNLNQTVGNLAYTQGADAETASKYFVVPYTFGVVGVYDSKTIPNYDGLGGSGGVLASGGSLFTSTGEYDAAEKVVTVNHGAISIATPDIATNGS